MAVDERGEHVMSDDFLSLMQRKTAKNEAWRQKCAAPKLVYDSALFFETCMHVYVFVLDATENSKEGGVAAEACSSQAGL